MIGWLSRCQNASFPLSLTDDLVTQLPSTVRFELSAREVEAIGELLAELETRFDSSECPERLTDISLAAHRLPQRLRSFLLDFRNTAPAGAYIVGGWPVKDDQIGPTPPHWAKTPSPSPTLQEELLLLLIGSIVGEVFGWATQQDGRIVHDLLPIREHEDEQLGSGSKQLLWWHTEDAFHPFRADYICLLCLRNPDRVATTLASSDALQFDPAWVSELTKKSYTIRPDESHLPRNNVSKAAEASFAMIEELQRHPEKIEVLFGDASSPPYMRLDPYFMDPSDSPAAREAFDALVAAIDQALIEVVLEPGDCLLLDNFRAVHGRVPFTARYDGTDRWLKRINVTRDLRKSRALRAGTSERVIG
jgi:Fe(II)/alpha-ketoglutarate-dependent arginine beta-hydroxylase